MKTPKEVLVTYSVSSVDSSTDELTYREGLVLMAMEEYAGQYENEIEKLKKQVEFFKKAGINLVEEKKAWQK